MLTSYNQLTIVFQGLAIKTTSRLCDFQRNVDMVKNALPGAKIILSTWDDAPKTLYEGVDDYVYSKDPGQLAPIKLNHPAFNNVNRQIVSTSSGLDAVKTMYAFKLRADFALCNANFLDIIGKHFDEATFADRVMVCMYYTLDPKGFERFSFHVSDWVQFGRTEVLKALWSAPLMTAQEASYFETHPHPHHFNFFEKQVRTKFAVEQFLWLHYAKKLGFTVPEQLVDLRKEVVRSYYEFIAKKLVVLDPDPLGLVLPKHHSSAKKTVFQYFNCINYADWVYLERKYSKIAKHDQTPPKGFRRRRIKKIIAYSLFVLLTPFHSIAYRPQLHWCRILLRRIFM